MEESLEARLIELEIRSEERASEIAKLEVFVRAYEGRIAMLERELRLLRTMVTDDSEGPPPPDEDLPPHY